MNPSSNDNDGVAIDLEVEGLTPLARLAWAVIVALTYDTQLEELPLARVLQGSGMSAEQWPEVYEELSERGVVWTVVTDWSAPLAPTEFIGSNAAFRLTRAVGAAGRASSREWAALREAAFARHGRQCLYCNSTEDVAVDHVLSVRRGGSNHIANLVPSCKACNSAKGSKAFSAWYELMTSRRGPGR
jgi:hypothetical protein